MRRIEAVARVEVLRLLRLRTTFTLLLLVPAMQVLLFGYAIRPCPRASPSQSPPLRPQRRTARRRRSDAVLG